MKDRLKIFIALLFFLCILGINSCTSNKAYRTNPKKICVENNCTSALIEEHKEKNEDYALTFIEFSERGNLFSRDNFDEVMEYIERENKNSTDGIMVIVYAHGWKHNATNKTGDVNKFRKTLKRLRTVNKKTISNRKVIGVYLGWRGLSLDVPLLNTLTYWGRKGVARQVGSGGVTEVLLRLNKLVYQEKDYRNVFVISGHSFGGALILSALKNIILEKMVNGKNIRGSECNQTPKNFKKMCSEECYRSEAFADSIVLLNPAIEANELMQIKELASQERCYSYKQPKLLHVISSKGDWVNRVAFPVGQWWGTVLQEKETTLKRTIFKGEPKKKEDAIEKIEVSEYGLDMTTAGNASLFRTGRYRKDNNYTACYQDNKDCLDKENKAEKILAISPFEPISVIYVDEEQIDGHSDISNDFVLSYMTTSVIENESKKNPKMEEILEKYCFSGKKDKKYFDFKKCLESIDSLYGKDKK